jgi:hypothetical protein
VRNAADARAVHGLRTLPGILDTGEALSAAGHEPVEHGFYERFPSAEPRRVWWRCRIPASNEPTACLQRLQVRSKSIALRQGDATAPSKASHRWQSWAGSRAIAGTCFLAELDPFRATNRFQLTACRAGSRSSPPMTLLCAAVSAWAGCRSHQARARQFHPHRAAGGKGGKGKQFRFRLYSWGQAPCLHSCRFMAAQG